MHVPRVRLVRHLVTLALVLTLASCGDSNGPEDQEVAGAWSGTIQGGATVATLTWTLTETNGTVSGNGSLATSANAVAVNVSGTFTSPTFSVSLTAPGFNTLNVTGTVAGDAITGSGNGSGFVSAPVSLTRQ